MVHPHLTIVHRNELPTRPISFSEKLADHCTILQGYLDTHITRNHSDSTVYKEEHFLQGWFEGVMVEDEFHPNGERQLLIWEAMMPILGRQRIVEFSKGLIISGLKPRTVTSHLGSLRRLFQYVLEWPYIKDSSIQSISVKYGRIEQPVLSYDYPVHAIDHDDEGFVLTGERLNDFYTFIWEKYIAQNQKKLTASRDYTMILLAGESGLRADEIRNLDAMGQHRDLFYEQGCIQTRFGKGVKGSGKRTRKTDFTQLAQETMHVYEEYIRSKFPHAKTNPALWLTESGERISYKTMWRNLHVIGIEARKAGLNLPPSFGWHSLRKSFATNYMEKHPEKVWELMHKMGHMNLSTLHRYVKFNRDYFDRCTNRIVSEIMSNDIEKTISKNNYADCVESEEVAGC